MIDRLVKIVHVAAQLQQPTPRFVNATGQRLKEEHDALKRRLGIKPEPEPPPTPPKKEKEWYHHWLFRLFLALLSIAVTVKLLTWFFKEFAKLVRAAKDVENAFA
jgi:hypothetical protein